jgi:hypothetical protein
MKVKKTDALDYNIRRGQFEMSLEDYHALQSGEVVDIPNEQAKILIEKGYAVEEGGV